MCGQKLKDKNGEMIKIGDTVSLNTPHYSEPVIFEVKETKQGMEPFCNPYALYCELCGWDDVKPEDCEIVGKVNK